MKDRRRVSSVELVRREDAEQRFPRPYLSLHRVTMKNRYTDGSEGPEYPYDAVLRKYLDAVVLVLTAEVDGVECVCLRRCIRPPLLLRSEIDLPVPDPAPIHSLWELPAGLVEDGDRGEEGLRRRASAEALEETGYRIEPGRFQLMRCAPFLSPGTIPEKIWFVVARVVDPSSSVEPGGDGSQVEEGAAIRWTPVDEALVMCDRCEIEDAKTELGIRRLASFPGWERNR